VDGAIQRYIEQIPAGHRPLFDRIHGLIMAAYPDATVVLSYKMPTYRAGGRKLHLAVWQHGVSFYGGGTFGGFTDRHPTLKTSKGTLRITAQDAAAISDEEFSRLIRAALG
jgi:uncharacterized protein YdhG (YjbR/CyaY superfamily)